MDGEPAEIKNGDKAAVIAETENKKEVDEMPPTYDEAKSLTTDETAVKITSNETKIDIGKEKEDPGFQGLTKDELMKYANDPYWVRMRWFLFILFWIIWVAMLVVSIVIIIYAPKCPSPEPKAWWQKSPLYKVDIATFKDSNNDDIGDLAGIKSKLDYLVQTGVGTVYVSQFLQQTSSSETKIGYDIQDYMQVDSKYGNLEDWKALVTALKERDQKVVIDFVPNHTSDQHMWFESSVAKEEPYTDFYIWNEGGGAGSPPNDWTGADGNPAWTWHQERGAWYLHQLGPNQPDLNMDNPRVVKELENVLKHWIGTGVNGFVIHDLPSLVDGPVSGSNDKDVGRQVEIIKKFRAVVDAETEDSGVPCILYADVNDLDNEQVGALYGDKISGANVGNLIHLPLSNTLQGIGETISAKALKETFDSYITGLPVNAWPSFSIQSWEFTEYYVDPLTMFKMLLPGTSLSKAGEELGQLPAKHISKAGEELGVPLDHQQMMWEAAAFQRNGSESNLFYSHHKLYSLLANKLRHQEAILFGDLNTNSTFVVDDSVFMLTRIKKGNPGYLLAMNIGSEGKTVDLTAQTNQIPANIRMMAMSNVQGRGVMMLSEEATKRVDSDKVPLKPYEAKIFTFVPNFE